MENSALSDLLKIGLTEGESKVYSALLELGSSTVGPLIKRSGVSHSNVYEILDRLIEKGIVTFIIKNGIKNFQGVSPINLSKYLEKKQKELDNQKKLLEEALPRIKALENLHPNQEAMLFIGIKGLLAAYKELFRDAEPGDENLWTYVHGKKYEAISNKFYVHSLELPKFIKSKGIADVNYRKSEYIKDIKKKFEIKFVDFPVFSHGEVFKDKFLLTSWEDPVISVLVNAKHVSENFRKYFYELWKIAKK